jgi:hypothetical protein
LFHRSIATYHFWYARRNEILFAATAALPGAVPDAGATSLTSLDEPATIEQCVLRFSEIFPTSKLSPPGLVFARSRDCDEFTGVAAGASARALRAYDYPMALFIGLSYRYEAAGIGRKEFKIKHLL